MGNFPIDGARPVGPAVRGDETPGLQQNRYSQQQMSRIGGEEDDRLFATRAEENERTGGIEREEELTRLEAQFQPDYGPALSGGSSQDRAPEDLPGRIIDILV